MSDPKNSTEQKVEPKGEQKIESKNEFGFETWFRKLNPDLPLKSVGPVLVLAAEGATVPFMARYRKEQTGNLDEVQIRKVLSAKEEWDDLLTRQRFIVGEIEKQGKLTETLKTRLLSTWDKGQLEDLYLPFKLKRKTKAEIAREAGLGEIADLIWAVSRSGANEKIGPRSEWMPPLISAEKGLPDEMTVQKGIVDILSQKIADDVETRSQLRDFLLAKAFLWSEKGEKAKDPSKFENYFQFSESVKSLQNEKTSHRYLALRRGWKEEELKLKIGPASTQTPESWEQSLLKILLPFAQPVDKISDEVRTLIDLSMSHSLKNFLLPSIETEIHRNLKTIADGAAIGVFGENLENLLLAAPLGPKTVLGVDPGIRSGSKLAVVDKTGTFKIHELIHTQSLVEKKTAALTVLRLVRENNIEAIAVGNGTHGREVEDFIRQTLKEAQVQIPIVRVSESGASIYSASDVAREEFPDLDLTIRGAISIARRLQDPLAELVKVDPKSIGVGQYQHDVAPAFLKKSLEEIVDSCVNRVGINLNTASPYLLARVSGIGPGLAKSIIEHRSTQGLFKSRNDLLEIPRFSKKTFELSAGFVRVPESSNPLDNTGVHPERYETLQKWATELAKPLESLTGEGAFALRQEKRFAEEIGPFTFEDICKELEKPGRDPRESFVPMVFRDDIHELKDLKVGMDCPGVVTNVTNFGAFVDIGVHQDGLVHLSQLADQFVKDPREFVKPGDRVQVKVLEVDLKKNQVALTMRTQPQRAPSPRPEQPRPQQQRPQAAARPQGERPAFGGGRPQENRGPRPQDNRGSGPHVGQGPRFESRPESRSNSRSDSRSNSRPDPKPERGLSSRQGLVYNPFADALGSLSLPKSQGGKKK